MPTVLAIMAHPDDIEFTCAGTLILLKRAKWTVHLATMTAGDLGTMTRTRAAISRIRRGEAAASARILGASYTCLGFGDLTISYSVASKRRVSALVRLKRPDLMILPSPVDYMADHEETPRIAREAAFASTVPNWRATLGGKRPRPCAKLPAILYADPIDHVDHFGRRIVPHRVVDVTDVIRKKTRMLACHESQRSWLREQHGEDEYLNWMKRYSSSRAKDVRRKSVRYAEGFRLHLGHGFPHEDVLTETLGKRRVKSIQGG